MPNPDHPTLGAPLKLTKSKIIIALKKHKGQVYLTAQKLGICYATLRNYWIRWPELKLVIKESRRKRVEAVGGKMFLAADRIGTKKERSNDIGAAKFILATQGKDMGWVDRTEVRHGGDAKAPSIKTEQSVRFVDELDLPFDVNRVILEAARAKGITNGQVPATSPE